MFQEVEGFLSYVMYLTDDTNFMLYSVFTNIIFSIFTFRIIFFIPFCLVLLFTLNIWIHSVTKLNIVTLIFLWFFIIVFEHLLFDLSQPLKDFIWIRLMHFWQLFHVFSFSIVTVFVTKTSQFVSCWCLFDYWFPNWAYHKCVIKNWFSSRTKRKWIIEHIKANSLHALSPHLYRNATLSQGSLEI